MRVAHFVNSLTKASGVSVFCSDMAQHLAELGVDVDIYVWWVGDDARLPCHERVNVIETRYSGLRPLVRPDVVHIHSLWVSIAHQGCRFARKYRIPYVYSTHGMLTPWALRQKWWKKAPAMVLYQYWDLQKASVLHATAPSESDAFRRLRLAPSTQVIPLGTEIPRSRSVSAEHCEEPVGFTPTPKADSPQTRTVLFLSRIHPVKGLPYLIDAWAELTQDLRNSRSYNSDGSGPYNWRLIIAGPDSEGHKAELISAARTRGLVLSDISDDFDIRRLDEPQQRADVLFTGPVYGSEKDQLYELSNLFVLPTLSENFGAVVADALGHGLPVITTKGAPWSELEGGAEHSIREAQTHEVHRNGTLDDISLFERCGWWIDIGVEPLLGALKEAIHMSDTERTQMGAAGKRLVESKYTWPVIAQQMKNVYSRVIEQKYMQ